MYIRNVKQIIRAADPTFDERRFGFGGLMDLLRACQRDGLMRLERDRRGGLRVFPGAALQKAAEESTSRPMDVADDEQQPMDAVSGNVPMIQADSEPADLDAQPIDTTAELLGRAKSRRPRAKAAPAPAPPAKKKRAAAAPAKRGSRAKKSASDDNAGNR